jgi:hypothetical protein
MKIQRWRIEQDGGISGGLLQGLPYELLMSWPGMPSPRKRLQRTWPPLSRRHGCKPKQVWLWRRLRPSKSGPGSRIERMGVEKVKESKKSSETYTYWIGLLAIG